MKNRYLVTCLKCGESDILAINDVSHEVLEFVKMAATNLLAARWRKDLKWGFECRCGNDNRLAQAEADDFDKLVQGDKRTVKRIADSLKIADDKQFKMAAV